MGFAANGFCFDTAEAAAAYACGKDFPVVSVVVDASGAPASVVVECTGSASNQLQLQRDVNGSAVGTSLLPLNPPACDVTEWHTYYPFSWSATDGATVAAAIAGVWFVGWGIRMAIRALHLGGSGSAGSSDE